MTVVVSTAKCICSPYSAYSGVGNVVPTMMAAKAYASMPKARRVFVLVLGTLNNSDPGWGRIPPREPGNAHRSVRGDGLLGPDAGERPHLELGIDLRVTAVRRRQSADDAEDEGQRNRHNARIGQREPGEVHVRKHRCLRTRHRGGEDDQNDRRDQSAEYRIVGRFAAAATAKASATRNAMFCPLARMPSAIAKMPSTTTVMRDTRTCSSSVTWWLFSTLA